MFDVPFFILATIVIIVLYKTSRHHRERMEMLRKGVTPSMFAEVPISWPGNKSLLLELLSVAVGLAFLISYFLMGHGDEGMIVACSLFLFSGGSILLYWKLTAQDREHQRHLQEKHFAKIFVEDSLGVETD